MSAARARQLRILALHGFQGSAAVLQRQLRPLARAVQAEAAFVCVDAPARAQGGFGWWRAVPSDANSEQLTYSGWARARDFILELCEREGPFDGVFGFSQGAALAGLLVALRAPFGFALMAGGFKSADPEHAALYRVDGGFQTPSLHLIGRSDGIVVPERSRALALCFARPLVLEHDGGHVIARESPIIEAARGFLQKERERVARGA